MQLQSFDSPRKMNDLGAGVCAGALLLGLGIVGMLTIRPVRLSMQPFGQTGGGVTDVALESGQELALLSKEVAVVLGADNVLWAVLDLDEAVKVRQVARDVRALCPRPYGESALALGTDGRATALTLSRSVVGVRTFSLRGTLRACDVGEHVTYVVIDGEGGGQFRIHPGATPELGTSARTVLPSGAAALDRVRGGQLLSAVYKRGEATLCVVRGPLKLEAKLLQLEAKPADVAVLDDNLLVAFADGRLALYDGEAIARAGDAPMEPTAILPLVAQGRPRVILTVAGRGGPSLWVGTSAGEVLCVPLQREQGEAVSRTFLEAPRLRSRRHPSGRSKRRARRRRRPPHRLL